MNFKLIRYNQLDSTNAEAIRLYQENKAIEGTVIIADGQTGGKGYGSNKWESEQGKNLTFSILLKPYFLEPSEQFIITQLISLSIQENLESILRKKSVTIKWPNDIYVGDKKIAGILIQNFIKGNAIDMSVIGVGINASQKKFISDAPNPTSIIIESGMDCPLDNLLDDILETFSRYISGFKTNGSFSLTTKLYLNKLYRFGKKTIYKDKQGTFMATITGVNEYGQLQLIDDTGSKRVYGFKEIEFMLKL
jgi:BirA family biotin operon repressor/biotin-[acetyl-CoA-carboxylase] ligase